MPFMLDEQPTLNVAIVGGGIAGAVLAIGLINRGINVKLYERARDFSEVGAGLGFTPNAEWAMKVIDPLIHVAFKKVAVQNSTDWFTWIDSYTANEATDGSNDELIYNMYLGERGFEGCHRAQFLDELAKLIPRQCVEFRKNLRTIEERGEDQKMVVVGCDGIRSRVRQLVLGEDHPAAYPGYSHKYAFRGLIPMEKAVEVLGEKRTASRFMHLGQGAHALTFPVAGGTLLNVVAFVNDPEEWPHSEKLTSTGTKQEAVNAFKHFAPTTRAIIDLLPEKLDRWAIFDTFDNPAPTYVKGRMVLMGDAAHASSPHHGAGAGMCIEDAAALVGLLQMVQSEMQHSKHTMSDLLRLALATYDQVRLDRSHWLVETSRYVGELYEWQHGSDPVKISREIDWRARKIWAYNIEEMSRLTKENFTRRLWKLDEALLY
ncbi:hypothetical protein BDV25DRAFT_131163 [Aspergillus avenaceus]|uniref:FAD-binding domain-containing protein n=1 Tax=Aspergillus avenaceus TaxID=36643 RepID=A0A5N6TQ89_ASPAV|nr:hypothetical protein BDV25DRAFT_131163 [Aspergillus avenaceus]